MGNNYTHNPKYIGAIFIVAALLFFPAWLVTIFHPVFVNYILGMPDTLINHVPFKEIIIWAQILLLWCSGVFLIVALVVDPLFKAKTSIPKSKLSYPKTVMGISARRVITGLVSILFFGIGATIGVALITWFNSRTNVFTTNSLGIVKIVFGLCSGSWLDKSIMKLLRKKLPYLFT